MEFYGLTISLVSKKDFSLLVDNRSLEEFLQLHVLGGTYFCANCGLLRPSVFCFRLDMQVKLILTVLRSKILCGTCSLVNPSSKILKEARRRC